jgi:hypothetical protein
MKKKAVYLLSALLISIALFSCKKKTSADPVPVLPIAKNVKYEITGNYSGKLVIAYTAANASTETSDVNSLPWEKSFTADPSTLGVGASASSSVSSPGLPSQTAVLKIYVNGVEVRSGAGTVNSTGYISLNPAAYVFP